MLFFNSVRNLGITKTAGAFPLTSKGASSGTESSLQINTWTALLIETVSLFFGSGEKCLFYFTQIQFKNLSKVFHFAFFSCKSPPGFVRTVENFAKTGERTDECQGNLLWRAARWPCGPRAAALGM